MCLFVLFFFRALTRTITHLHTTHVIHTIKKNNTNHTIGGKKGEKKGRRVPGEFETKQKLKREIFLFLFYLFIFFIFFKLPTHHNVDDPRE